MAVIQPVASEKNNFENEGIKKTSKEVLRGREKQDFPAIYFPDSSYFSCEWAPDSHDPKNTLEQRQFQKMSARISKHFETKENR